MAYVEHNHNTYNINAIMQPGQCSACDERWGDLNRHVWNSCPFCGKKVYITLVILMTWMCPHCKKKWYDG